MASHGQPSLAQSPTALAERTRGGRLAPHSGAELGASTINVWRDIACRSSSHMKRLQSTGSGIARKLGVGSTYPGDRLIDLGQVPVDG